MSPQSKRTTLGGLIALTVVLLIGYLFFNSSAEPEEDSRRRRVAAVAVAAVEHRPIALRRTFSGTLESHTKFVIAPKVAGRVQTIPLDIADAVRRGDTVALLDNAEFDQNVRQAQAELAVAEANLAEARSVLEISLRAYQRATTLRERGIASESEYDSVQADLLAREAQVEVADAQVARAESSLESARIRLSYTRITADWSDGGDLRYVAERYVNEGETVSANDPLLLIVGLDPITAVINVTERDYGLIHPGLAARFTTDAFPRETFEGAVERVSPVFRESSRQARVELSLNNPEDKLKPGMFVRATITLQTIDDATVAPYAAVTRRNGQTGVFLVSEDGQSVSWRPVDTGVRDGESIQVLDNTLSGRVVTLGQHLLDDGSPITIPEGDPIDFDS